MMTFKNPGKDVGGGVCAPSAFCAAAAECGVKDPKNPRLDLGLVFSEVPTSSAGVFTTNQIKAAPVKVSQAHLGKSDFRAFFVNSGNANACTGPEGVEDAQRCASEVAKLLGLSLEEVGICSTGVIGLPLPVERISRSLPTLASELQSSHAAAARFSESILTSDTRAKEIAVEVNIDGKPVRIGACAKGAGMIMPSMATMLCFVTTDAEISKEVLQGALCAATQKTFNRISIDGDMSTNDTILMMANGRSGVTIGGEMTKGHPFYEALCYVLDSLAREVVLDGEKVTKFVTLEVVNARSEPDARRVAEAVANSPLVKSAWNGNDPNWGRVIHAVGYSQARIQEDLIDISWDSHRACEGGKLGPASIEALRKVASADCFTLTIDLKVGEDSYYMYTSDLSPEYVDYNRSEYSYWDALAKHCTE